MYIAQIIISRGIIVAKLLSAGISAKEILRFLFVNTNSRFSMKRTLFTHAPWPFLHEDNKVK